MAQFARPFADLDNTGVWTTAPLWSDIDDGDSPDGTVVVSDTTPTTSEPFTVDLSTLVDPALSTGHILRIRWAKNSGGGGGKTIRIELREGYVSEGSQGTLIATDDYSINSTTLNTDETALSGAEADAITDYADLQIRVMGVASNRALKVDFVELEAPPVIVTGAAIGHAASSSGATAAVLPPAWDIYRPTSDEVAGDWVTAPLWSKIDDDPTDSGADSDVISATGTSIDATHVGLATISQPDTFVGWRIRIRARLSSGTKQVVAWVSRKSDQATLYTRPDTQSLTGSFAWYEWESPPHTAVDLASVALSDFAIGIDTDNTSGTIEVSAIELRIPILSGLPLGDPSFGDMELSVRGKAGPHTADSKQWVVGIDPTEKIAWAWSATDPSDGHNPSDWTRRFPIGSIANLVTGGANTAFTASDRRPIGVVDSFLNRDGELVAFTWSGDDIAGPHGVVHAVAPATTIPSFVKADASLNGVLGAANDHARLVERTDISDAYKAMNDGNVGNLRFWMVGNDTDVPPNVTSDPHTVFDLIAADNRIHTFYGKTDADLTQGVRQRTWRSGNTFQTEPGSDDTSEDIARLGVGVAIDTGSIWKVVAPFPQADGGGIMALVFDSADSPTPTEQVASTRDAYDAAYEQSVIAIGMGPNVAVVVFLDDTTSEAIYAATRGANTTTWTDEGLQVAALAGRTRMSAEPIDVSTVGVLVAATTGNIFYYEFRLPFVSAVGHGTASGTVTATVVEGAVLAAGHAVSSSTVVGTVVGVVQGDAEGHATAKGTSVAAVRQEALAAGHVVASGQAAGSSGIDVDANAIGNMVSYSTATGSAFLPSTDGTRWGINASVS